jgi:putative pyruvate formate lyase activating enzyme
MSYPRYLEAYKNGYLDEVIAETFHLLERCSICPRRCKVNRIKDEQGFCKTGLKPKVCSFMLHHGEEPPISGRRGSGTIFFSCCNMACVYCQNYEFSQLGQGSDTSFQVLADFMLQLQDMGCHNINLVTPTHVMPQILQSLGLAVKGGLKLPIVYNSGGYELAEIIKLLDGVIDIYLADMRYADSESAVKYSSAADYPAYNQEAVKEMYRQVGTVQVDADGIIKKGLIIRHLVLPNSLSGTDKIMRFISREISQDTYISLMSQYTPYFKAQEYKELSRRVTYNEYEEAENIMHKYGLYNGWTQDAGGLERFAGVNIKPSVSTKVVPQKIKLKR